MKKLSRILAVVSAAAMMLSLAACGSNGGSAANSGSTQFSASWCSTPPWTRPLRALRTP